VFRAYTYQVRGRRHEREGLPVQDRTAYLARAGTQVVCLADGAGSARNSGPGAQRVVEAGCARLVELGESVFSLSDPDLQESVLSHLSRRPDELSRRLDCEVRELASTFLAVVVRDERFVALHIGDGVVGARRGEQLVVLSGPDNGEYANETVFVTSPRAANSMRVVRGDAHDVNGFLLMSDGTAESLHDQRTDSLARACSKLLEIVAHGPRSGRNPEYKKQLRRLMDHVIRERTDDDCAVAILAR
jgi:hypothetical protein